MITRFGTAKEMIVQPLEKDGTSYLLAIDQRGLYLTVERYVDSNLSDPNRNSDRKAMEQRINDYGIDYKTFFEEHKHLIQAMPTEKAAKINPLKASKRSMKK